MIDLACVVTTIHPPTPSMRALAAALTEGAPLLIVGDRKGPTSFDLAGARLLSLADQAQLPFRLAPLLPTGHYARKNLGYLAAMSQQAGCIYETDDDNAPLPTWRPRALHASASSAPPSDWCNVYRYFTDETIWPRGLPLRCIRGEGTSGPRGDAAATVERRAPIQQGLADGSPDVDAIWRLVLDRPFTFDQARSVWLPPGTACPINSQSTWWWPEAFPLLYLPSHCSFRMTDIWRGFVAQRCLWAMDLGLMFHAPEVLQDRNVHDLSRDFADEVPGYLGNDRLMGTLRDCDLLSGSRASDVASNVARCWQALVKEGFVPEVEMPLVEAWAQDVVHLAAT